MPRKTACKAVAKRAVSTKPKTRSKIKSQPPVYAQWRHHRVPLILALKAFPGPLGEQAVFRRSKLPMNVAHLIAEFLPEKTLDVWFRTASSETTATMLTGAVRWNLKLCADLRITDKRTGTIYVQKPRTSPTCSFFSESNSHTGDSCCDIFQKLPSNAVQYNIAYREFDLQECLDRKMINPTGALPVLQRLESFTQECSENWGLVRFGFPDISGDIEIVNKCGFNRDKRGRDNFGVELPFEPKTCIKRDQGGMFGFASILEATYRAKSKKTNNWYELFYRISPKRTARGGLKLQLHFAHGGA